MYTVLNTRFTAYVHCCVGDCKSDFKHMKACAKVKCIEFKLSVHIACICDEGEYMHIVSGV